jgi:tRNA dimethylallyltransferase
VAIVGPTASGKSALALEVADASQGIGPGSLGRFRAPVELVSVDSMAVYRGMDIGTAKPSTAVRSRVRYHLVDLVEPGEEFTVREFQCEARRALADIEERGHLALLVGGTGLYLRSIVDELVFPGRFPEAATSLRDELAVAGAEGGEEERAALSSMHERLAAVDPIAARRIEPSNRRRLLRAMEVTIGSGRPFSSFGPGLESYPPSRVALVGLRYDPAETDRRIAERFVALMDLGLLDEVRTLSEHPGGMSRTARQALGYRELLGHVEDGIPLADAVAEAVRRTRAFARRQWAWFRRDPRIEWLDPDDDQVNRIAELFAGTSKWSEDAGTVGDCGQNR